VALRCCYPCSLLVARKGEDPPLAKIFHVLGEEDRGSDPERFEPELLLRRIERVEAQQKVLEALGTFSRHLADDVLNTSEMVVAPGLLAIELARSVSKANAEHRSALAPVLDAFRNMTKSARRRRAEQIAEEGAAPTGTRTP
jgi:hypothetical protein